MPKNPHTRSASPNRSRSQAREKQSGKGREGHRNQQENSAQVIADSIYALNLSSKPGVEVALKVCGKLPWYVDENISQLYSDLRLCYMRAMKQKRLPFSKLDLVAAGIPEHLALASLIEKFERELLPKGFDYNIDYDDYGNEGFYFTVFNDNELPDSCHIIEAKPLVMRLLKNEDGDRLRLLFEFFRCVHIHLGFSCWWDTHDWAIDHIEQRLSEAKESDDEDWSPDDIMDDTILINEYRYGMAKDVEKSISKSRLYKPQELLAKIKATGYRCKITRMMKSVLSFMVQNPYSIVQYEYFIPDDFDGLRLDWQFDIIWDRFDGLTEFHNQLIDDMYNNGGVYPMIYYFNLTKKSKYPDSKEIARRIEFPRQLDKMLTDSILFL